MNCSEVRDQLPLLLKGDVSAETGAALENHLVECAECRQVRTELQGMLQRLDAVPNPAMNVDLGRLYRDAVDQQCRKARRWRRLAIAVSSAAAAILALVLFTRMEFRIEQHQFVLRWGSPPAATAPTQRPAADVPAVLVSSETDARLQLLSDLIAAVAKDVEFRDEQRKRDIARFVLQFDSLRRLASSTERDVAAMYADRFVLPKKEVIP